MATDAQLVQRIRVGDHEAYSELFRQYYPSIYTLCLNALGDPAEAEEVAQESFIHAYLKLDQLRNPQQFGAWLRQIARNRCRNHRRSVRPPMLPVESVPLPIAATPEAYLLRQELLGAVIQAVESLPQQDRAVVRARIDGLNHEEIGELLGISTQASVSRLYRARKKIAAQVRELLHALIGLPRMVPTDMLKSGGLIIMKAKIIVISMVALGLIGTGVWIWRSHESEDIVDSIPAPAPESTENVMRDTRSPNTAPPTKPSTMLETQPRLDTVQTEPTPSVATLVEGSVEPEKHAKEMSTEATDSLELAAEQQRIQQAYGTLGETFQSLKSIWDEQHALIESHPPGMALGSDEEIAYSTQLYEVRARWIALFKSIKEIVPGATEITLRTSGGWKRNGYIIHRDVIESALGPMPAEVEAAFWPPEGVAFQQPSEAEFQASMAERRRQYESR